MVMFKIEQDGESFSVVSGNSFFEVYQNDTLVFTHKDYEVVRAFVLGD
jgi:hypothetical protein